MSMTRKITIDGKEVPFRASAAVPRIYRIKFHRLKQQGKRRKLRRSVLDQHALIIQLLPQRILTEGLRDHGKLQVAVIAHVL